MAITGAHAPGRSHLARAQSNAGRAIAASKAGNFSQRSRKPGKRRKAFVPSPAPAKRRRLQNLLLCERFLIFLSFVSHFLLRGGTRPSRFTDW